MTYKNFSTEDFVQDKNFRQWVLKPDQTSNTFWHEFLSENPDKLPVVNQARALVQEMQFPELDISETDITNMWRNIRKANLTDPSLTKTDNKEIPLHPVAMAVHRTNKSANRNGNNWVKVAASVAGIILISWILYFYFQHTPRQHLYQTAYGEIRTIVLPDSSVVTLNANTTLQVPQQWQADGSREVWLQGEAFFEIEKQFSQTNPAVKRKFLVHTDNLQIEVLGTKFNVNTRRSKTQVVLNSGKVKLTSNNTELMMEPGELAELSAAKQEFVKKGVNPNPYSSWKENKLICNGTTLQEIVEVMQDRFGVHAVLQDSALSGIEASGTIPLDDIDIFMAVLQKSIGLNITMQNNRVIITK